MDADAIWSSGSGNDVDTAQESVRGVRGRRNGLRDGLVLTLLLFLAVTYFPSAECTVLCNEFDTCFPLQQQNNITDAIQQGDRKHVCTVATTAMACLEEAREDCDNGYENLPSFIIQGLEDRKSNVTSYVTGYCGANGGDAVMNKMAATLFGTLFSMFLWFSS